MNGTTADQSVPLTSNGATASTVDSKIDPSIGQAISHGGGVDASEASAVPTYSSDTGIGEAITTSTPAVPEKSAPLGGGVGEIGGPGSSSSAVPEATTTTIITTTTGPPADGSAVVSPVSSREGPTSGVSPTATAGTGAALGAGAGAATTAAPASNLAASQDGTTNDTSSVGNDAVPAAAGVAAGGVGAAAIANEKKREPTVPAMSPKEAKKYNKLLKKEAKSEEKELSAALKSAHSDEKAYRKAKKAESQSISRHDSAISDEHKTSKALNKAQLAQDKAAAALTKAKEELEIKKRHTVATNEAYQKAKAKIDALRETRLANEKDRQRRQTSIARAAIQ